MERSLRWYDNIIININWFAITSRSQVLTPLIIPLLVQQFVGESAKGTYVGIMRLWALMVAVLIQALIGILSDRSTSRFGRRRPYIAIGTLGEIIIFVFIGFTINLEGMSGYWLLFGLYILSMITSNTSHAATQGLIPDLVPDEKKGIFSGVKALLELPLPLIFVSFVIGDMVAAGNLWGGLVVLMGVLVVCMLITMFVQEQPLQTQPEPMNWMPFLRLVIMTAAFTIIILGIGWLVNLSITATNPLPATTSLYTVAVIGAVGMAIAIVLGVWLSIRISLEEEADKHPSFTWWVVNRLAFLVGVTNIAGFVVFFLQEKFSELAGEKAAGPASRIMMFVGIFILLTVLPSGWLADRYGKKRLLYISNALAITGTAIIVIAPTLTLIYVGGCIIGGAAGLFYSVNWALGTKIVPKEKAGQFLGLSNLAGAGAGAIGAYIGGPIADNKSYVLLMSLYGVLFLLSMFAISKIEEKD